MQFLGFFCFCCTAGHVKRKHLEQTAVLTQDKCSAFGLKLFPQRLPLYSEAAGSAASSVCQLAQREYHTCTVTHTPVMNLRIIWSVLSHPCCASLHLCVSLDPYKPKETSFITCFGGAESRKGSGVLFDIKRERLHSNHNEGSNWFAITPPADQPVFDVGLLPGVCWGGKLWSRPDPCRPHGKPRLTWAPEMRLMSVSHAIHPCQTSDNRCRFLSVPTYPSTLDLATTRCHRCREAAMIYRDINMRIKAHTDQHSWGLFETSSCSSCIKSKSNWPAPAKPCNAIET